MLADRLHIFKRAKLTDETGNVKNDRKSRMKMALAPITFAENHLNVEWQMSKATFYLFHRILVKYIYIYVYEEIIHK